MERNVNDPNGAVEPASSGARQAIDKVTGALRPGVEHLAEDAQHAVDRVADAASRLKQTLQVGGGRLKDAQARFSAERRAPIADPRASGRFGRLGLRRRNRPGLAAALALKLRHQPASQARVMQAGRPPSSKGHGTAGVDDPARTAGAGIGHDRDDDGFAEAVDRLTRAMQTGSFEVPAAGKLG